MSGDPATAPSPIEPSVAPGTTTAQPAKKAVLFSSAARSVISQRRQVQQPPIPEEGGGQADTGGEVRAATQPVAHDPWSTVLHKVAKKLGATTSTSTTSKISLAHVLKSHGVRNLVKQSALGAHKQHAGSSPEARSAVMEHWVKTAMLRNQTDFDTAAFDEDDEDDDATLGIESGFDVRESRSKQMYGRTLLLEESCRRAFAASGENRSQMDLQALKAWFQMTKLKITTDFERLQPAELDLLCRRMVLASFHPKEIVFRQGDEGDALYLVFAGVVEVRVSQRILGEKVEVTVCELSKGDYFGERSLLNNDVRAATVLAKTSVELVRISRKDYNIMLKKDQMEFLSRMQMANGMVIPKSVQQSQREYIKVLTKKKSARTKADIDMLSEYLQTLKFFRALPKSFVRELCTVVDFLKLPAGAPVFKEGEVGDLFYIIFTGSVDVIVNSKDFRDRTQQTKLINLTEGAHFGELALMKGHGIRSATVMTREECKLLVICERDYNATLRRMQKEDLSKRVGVLDQIPIFQTPEWTGELLKEMSYVLSEQKLAAGSVLFQQGDKALQVFFVVRGELVMTKEIVDPASQTTHTVLVERIGRYRVVGDDAAAGTTFNEIIFREVTVTASTPVEVLVLSKYDVFHRLSRAAREALRAAAHSHAESVVYLDRFHKSDKWAKYKQRVLSEHTNHERLAKILPQTPRLSPHDEAEARVRTGKKRKQSKAKKSEPEATDVSQTPQTQTSLDGDRRTEGLKAAENPEDGTCKSVLVDANEFLLLAPHQDYSHGALVAESTRTLGHFVSTFNADAPPSTARKAQLEAVLTAERMRQVRVLNEGNPLAYFDLQAIKQQEKKHHAEARGRAASTRRTLLIGAATLNSMSSGLGSSSANPSSQFPSSSPLDSPLPSPMPTKAALVDKVATSVMNQYAHENFVFSRPARLQDSDGGALGHKSSSPSRHRRYHHHQDGSSNNSSESELLSSSRRTSSARREQAQQLCDGGFVVLSVRMSSGGSSNASEPKDGSTVRSLQSPLVRILQAVSSQEEAREIAMRARATDERAQAAASYYVLPKKKYAVLPRAALNRSHATDEQLQRELWEKFARSPAMSAGGGTASPVHGRRPSVSSLHVSTSSFPERAVATAPSSLSSATSPAEASWLFASLHKIAFTEAEQREIAGLAQALQSRSAGGTADNQAGSPSAAEPAASNPLGRPSDPRLFAVASLILSKHEIENAVGGEPFLCVHELFVSEMLAMDAALTMTPQHFRNALLCVLPVDEFVHVDDAYDWCIQVESDRREKRSSSSLVLSPNRNRNNSSTSSSRAPSQHHQRVPGTPTKATVSPRINGAGSPSKSSSIPANEWQVEREKAHRLHQFICSRLGQKAAMDKERREQQEATGFTPKATLTLDEKLATLHEYLESSNAAAVSARGSGGGAHAMGKYRQMKKFGSIMKARLGSTLGSSGLSISMLASLSSNSSSSSASASPGSAATPSQPTTPSGS